MEATEVNCYPDTDVLINNLGCKRDDLLQETVELYEKNATHKIHDSLKHGQRTVPKKNMNFNLEHLQAIHKEMYGKIFEWAGEIRDVNLVRNDCTYSPPGSIALAFNGLTERLKNENYFIGQPFNKQIDGIAKMMDDLHRISPFREMNDMAIAEFTHEVGLACGLDIDFNRLTKDEIIVANTNSFHEHFIDPDRERGQTWAEILPAITTEIGVSEQRDFMRRMESQTSYNLQARLNKAQREGKAPKRVSEEQKEKSSATADLESKKMKIKKSPHLTYDNKAHGEKIHPGR